MKKQNKKLIKPSKESYKKVIQDILNKGDIKEVRALFQFDNTNSNEEILKKFDIWTRYFYFKYFHYEDAPFHRDIDTNNLKAYRGEIKYFIDIAFRGAAKTSRTKLFIAFCIANDADHTRKFIKVLAKDSANSKQITTDIYNMLIQERVRYFYSEIFQKSDLKREETMSSFTTSFGVKLSAGTVGTEHRGDQQEDARPDLLWFEDFETRKSLKSAVETNTIFDNMEEARTGLSKNGVALYNCNYLSERGNVHKLVKWTAEDKVVLITPIYTRENGIAWEGAYTLEDIRKIKMEAKDFAGEYLCVKPDTPILTKDGWKQIDTLKIGDKVISHLNREQKILNVMESEAEDLLDITVNGETVTITRNHPVLTVRGDNNEWIPAGELTLDDLVAVIPRGKLII